MQSNDVCHGNYSFITVSFCYVTHTHTASFFHCFWLCPGFCIRCVTLVYTETHLYHLPVCHSHTQMAVRSCRISSSHKNNIKMKMLNTDNGDVAHLNINLFTRDFTSGGKNSSISKEKSCWVKVWFLQSNRKWCPQSHKSVISEKIYWALGTSFTILQCCDCSDSPTLCEWCPWPLISDDYPAHPHL